MILLEDSFLIMHVNDCKRKNNYACVECLMRSLICKIMPPIIAFAVKFFKFRFAVFGLRDLIDRSPREQNIRVYAPSTRKFKDHGLHDVVELLLHMRDGNRHSGVQFW
jgi:hypothetical protein